MNQRNTRAGLSVVFAGLIAIPMFAQGCADELCCTDPTAFTVEGNAEATGQFQAAAGAVADLSAVAQGSFDDVVNACRAIAIDLDADAAARDTATNAGADNQAKAWCDLAVAQIQAKITANGGATLTFEAPKCSASISAKANCQAKCSGSAQCDVKATPPTCEGGKLEVECKGSCDVSASAPKIACEGKCAASCEGSCSATAEAPSVECDGKCEGTCEGSGGAGTSGLDAQGNCNGTCSGTCTAKPGSAKLNCAGSCKGSCTGSCTATPGSVAVKCDGECKGEITPLSCKGGELKGGCKVEAKCDANCEASASAKAECTPPQVTLVAKGAIEARYLESLKVNLPNLLVVFQARGQAFVGLIGKVSGSLAGSVSGDLGVKGLACLNSVASGIGKSTEQMTASVQASGSVVTSLQ